MPPNNIHHLHISTGTMFRFFGILLGLVVFYLIWDILSALIFAVIVASAMEPAIGWLSERKIPRILSVILIYLILGMLLFFVFYLVFPIFAQDLIEIYEGYPLLQKKLLSGFERAEDLPFFSIVSEGITGFLRVPSEYLAKLSGGILDVASAFFGGAFTFFLIIVFSFYLATQERGIENFLRLITPLSYEPYVISLWERSQRKLGRWLQVQLLLGALVGVLIFIGLTFLNVRQALFFALLAAVFEIIPVVGPILAAVPAVAMTLFISPLLGLLTALLFVVVQQVESHVIVPVVMRRTIGLSPLVVVLALLIGAKLGGIFGILLAVPLTAIGAEFVNDWDKKKRALIPE